MVVDPQAVAVPSTWPAANSNLRTDIVAGMSRAGVEAEEMSKHADSINRLELNALSSPQLGAVSGIATLDASRRLPAAQLTVHTHVIPIALARVKWDLPTQTDITILGTSQGAQTITAVRALRVGGTSATINFRVRGTTQVLTADMTVTTGWTQVTAIANASLADLDQIEGMLQSVAGGPTVIIAELLGTRVSG
jgi:hypothetical protein